MKVSKAMLEQIIREELDIVIQERNLQKEHRGKPCNKRTGKDRINCEKQAEDAIIRRDKKTSKRREQSANDEELQALGRGKVYGMKPKAAIKKDDVKPKDAINPSIGKELRQEKKGKDKKICTSRKDGKGHNPYHDSNGRLTTASKAVSKSIRDPQDDDCKYGGQSKHNPHRFTSIVCGRKDRLNPNSHSGIKCKDGSKVSEMLTRDGLVDDDTQVYDAGYWYIIRKSAFEEIITQEILDTMEDLKSHIMSTEIIISEGTNELQQRCEKAGYRTFEQLIRSFNSLVLSSKGELFKEPKK